LGRRFGSSSPRFLRRSLVGCCRTSRIGFRMQWFASGERGLRFCRTQRRISFRVDALGRRFRRSSPCFLRRALEGVCRKSRIRFRMQ
jgi:hypothetical protein